MNFFFFKTLIQPGWTNVACFLDKLLTQFDLPTRHPSCQLVADLLGDKRPPKIPHVLKCPVLGQPHTNTLTNRAVRSIFHHLCARAEMQSLDSASLTSSDRVRGPGSTMLRQRRVQKKKNKRFAIVSRKFIVVIRHVPRLRVR